MNLGAKLRAAAARSHRLVALRNRWSGHNAEHVTGRHNVVDRGSAVMTYCSVRIIGNRNRVTIGDGARLRGVSITVRGDGHSLVIGSRCQLTDTEFAFEDAGCEITVGADTTCQGGHIAAVEPGMRVVIGEDCMFSRDIYVATTDSHSILDAASQRRINPPANVTIEDHVWLGASAKILKGVHIGSGAIVGIGTVVTRPVEPHTLVAGNPGRVIRAGVTWARPRI